MYLLKLYTTLLPELKQAEIFKLNCQEPVMGQVVSEVSDQTQFKQESAPHKKPEKSRERSKSVYLKNQLRAMQRDPICQ
jgi:hypothetical protein